MKKLICVLLAVAMLFALSSCGGKEFSSDTEYIKDKGKLIVGITEFAPMDYKDKDTDEWVGFDADMAREFATYLGVDAEFIIIDWDNKAAEIDAKSIDCVWNGMTICDEVTAAMDCTAAYCNNQQIVVVNKDVADKYKTVEACKELSFAVENGSAGKDQAIAHGFKYTEVIDQATALQEVAAGTSDAAIIDSLMAGAMIGAGTSYDQLVTTVGLNDEEYGVGFRKGSDLVNEFAKFYDECKANGTLKKVAEKYGVQEALID